MTEFGISLLPDNNPEQRTAAEYFADMLAVSRLTEQLGLEYVKMTEHYMRPYGGYCPDPLAFLSAVAAVTSNVRLMTGGIQASFHHPVQVAAQTAQLDALSGGRMEVGFARAFLPYEFDTFGVDMDSSKDRFRESVQAVVRLWTEQKVTEDSRFFRYSDVTSLPPPVQHPHPPVWAAALLTRSSFEWIGDSGFNLLIASSPSREKVADAREMIDLYRDRFRAAPANAGREPKVAISVPLLLAESDREARELGWRLLRRHWDTFSDAATSWHGRASSSYEGYREAVTKRYGPDSNAEELEWAVFGDPGSAVGQVRELCTALAPDVILWQLDFGQQPLDTMARSLRLFAGQVRPRLGAS
jgi:alkanesulfonate monooxygenase SsuD/methylene tetrahydromethanopterin reductase-like flavin-dependent oxidoreductase (luciferase family)